MEPENRAQPAPEPPAQRPDDPSESGRLDRPRSEGGSTESDDPPGHAGRIGLRRRRHSDSTTDPVEPVRRPVDPAAPVELPALYRLRPYPAGTGPSRATPRRDTTSRDTDTGATASLATTSPAVRRPAMAVIRQRATDDRDTASSPAIRARTTASPVMASAITALGNTRRRHTASRTTPRRRTGRRGTPHRAMGSSPMANRTIRPRATPSPGTDPAVMALRRAAISSRATRRAISRVTRSPSRPSANRVSERG